MKRSMLSLALALILSLAACSGGTPSETQIPAAETTPAQAEEATGSSSHYPVTITSYDYAGNPVEYTYEKAPERVLCVYQGCIETMIALGLEDHVLASYGLDNEVKEEWKEGFARMHYDETVFAPDKETVTLLEPDMIFSWGSYFGEKKLGDVGDWNEKGVGTYMNSNTVPGGTRTLENEYTDILNIGKIFDVEDHAQALVDEMKAQVEATLAAAQGQEPVRVAVVEPTAGGTITNYGADSLAGDMVVALGGELARTEGILLDPVYTGKAWSGMLELLKAGGFGSEGDIVFVHTGGAAALFAMDLG